MRPAKGAIYIDDVRLTFPVAGELVAADFERTLRNLRVWMLGEPGTTLVTGNGLGPDLQKPVPFVMTRRKGTSALFVTLFEPYGDAPQARTFRSESSASFTVSGADFDDRVSFDQAGVLRYLRRREGELVRIGLAGGDALQDGFRALVRLSQAGSLQADFSERGRTAEVITDAAGPVRLHAPDLQKLIVNGRETAFERDGANVVFTAPVV